MQNSQFISYAFMIVIILLVFWLRGRRSANPRPIRRNGYGMFIPVVLLLVGFSLSIASLTNIPDRPFHLPAIWELLCAGLLGAVLGSIMLYHTGYEKREDGQIYPKANKYFRYILLGIIVFRIALAQYFQTLDPSQFAVLTMVMAFLYICIWRIGSFVKYRQALR